MNAEPQLRRGTGADANIAAEVYLRARHHAVPEIPPLAHPDDEVRQWMHRVLDEQEAWLAVADDGTLLGLMVLDGDWVEQLYMDPARTGRGLGTRFVELAKQRKRAGCSCGRSYRMCGPSGSMSATALPSRSALTGAAMRRRHPI